MGDAEHMIDELIKHIKANQQDLSSKTSMEGEEIRRTNFLALDPTKKARIELSDTNSATDSTHPLDIVVTDFEAELAKQRDHSEKRLQDLHKAFNDEIAEIKVAFSKRADEILNRTKEYLDAYLASADVIIEQRDEQG
jgi:ElaB/YqjD/DUF883 family membrane-anchored ribosome-binding protein